MDKKSSEIIKSPKSTLDNTISSPSDTKSSTRSTTEAGPSQQLASTTVISAEPTTNSEEVSNSANPMLKTEIVFSKPCRVTIKPLKDLIEPAELTKIAINNSQTKENIVRSSEPMKSAAIKETAISSRPAISLATKAVKQADDISIVFDSGLAATCSDLDPMSPTKKTDSKIVTTTSHSPKSRKLSSLTQKSTTAEVSSIPSGSKSLKSTSETSASASSIQKKATKETVEKDVKENVDKTAKIISTKMRKDRPRDETFEEGTTKENNSLHPNYVNLF